ncbi:ADP-ribosylglycohydrolase family protein [Streptomyces sp. NBC_00091]|uniref:ADP-ribosylglycohydrolase family protein n=1 Tax=Streptomyces sp. NBC_00091 TaxID=2975648 RepID=UPI002257BE8F|nr:ADP-ribosylglycohydrolase family protein [Streptomyces sp. NBC_00091]MCX5376605.1 ADP-ribosylglycohydrolase family protein [Streptomyces sp. NBC_00091]
MDTTTTATSTTPAAGTPATATGDAQATGAAATGATGTALWGRAEQQDFRSRVRGTLLGSAIGDALGAPLAGLSLEALRETHGPAGLTEPAPAHGRRGAVTAATQLTLFTVDGLIRAHVRRDAGGWHPPTDVHRAHLRWAATQRDWGPDERRKDNGWLALEEWLYARRDPARACLTGFADDTLGTLEQPKNPTARDAAATVRSAPFGLLVGWEPALVLQLAVECATQSHGHPTAYLSAGALAVIVHGMTRGDSLDTAVQRALTLLATRPGHQPVTGALRRAVTAVTLGAPGPRTVESLTPGDGGEGHDAGDTLAIAVYCALVAEDVPHGLRLAVNHGGDSTATGALCGALLGALHGETALPAGWLAELEGRATILELADDFALEMTQGPALHGPSASAPGWLARYPRG